MVIIRPEARHAVRVEEMFNKNDVLVKIGDLELEITKDQGQELILELERFCMEQNETYHALETLLRRTMKSLEQSSKRETELLNFVNTLLKYKRELNYDLIFEEATELLKTLGL